MKKMLNELVRYGKFAFALAFALCCFSASATAITPAEHFAKKVDFTIGGYLGTSTLANFPVLVKLSASAVSGFNYSECAQNSIRFLDGSGNLIPHEVDTWNDSGESFIWVSVPSLSGTSTKITMCYGGNGATCDAATGNVWTDASYKSVWHLNIASNSTSDSATSANTASVLNSNEYCGAGTGLIGGGYFCEQNTAVHALEAPASASASFAPTTANTLTYTAWVRQIGGYTASTSPEGYDQIRWGEWGNCGTIWHTGNNNGNSNTGIGIGVESGKSNDSSAFAYFDAKLNLRPAVTNIYDGEWHQVVARYVPNGDNATVTIWVDGQQKCSITGKYTNPSTSSDKVYMGARINSNNDCVWTGGLDEMRFRDAASSDDWIAAEYANVTLTSFMSNSGAVNIGDEPLALGWTAEPMSANGDTIRTDGVFKYGYARNDVNAVGQYTVNGVTFTALHDGGDFRNTDKNPNVVVSPGDFDWVGSLGDEGASGDYGKMLANAFGSTNLKGDYTFTLKNLEAGKTYLVQVVAHRTGQPYPVTSPDSTKVIYAGGTDWTYGGSLICVFDANTTEYSFTLNYGTWIMLNAIQVRELGDAPVKPAPWDSEHGPFAKRIAFTASGYEGSETLENFPVLVRLSTAISGFNYTDCGTNGANIQFADDNGHVLPYEIDTWNASGESLIWVNVASLSRGARFYMYFGGTPSAANISTSTWNSNYVGVWHMSEVKGSVADATGHGLTAVPTGSNGQYNDQVATTCCRYTGTDAPVGYARTTSTTQAVGGNDGRLVIAHDNQLNIGDTFTFSTWVRKTTNENYTRIVSKKSAYTSETGWEVEVSGNTFNARGVSSGKTANECTGDFPTMMSNWVHVVVVYDNTTITVYGNGEAIKTNTVAGAANDSDRSLVIGANASDSFGNRINGAFDECRLLDAVASADWVKAEYQQSAKPEFLVAGAVETHVASTYTVSWTGGVNATVVATVDSTPIDTGDSVEDGKTVCFTVTPANGYEFASAPTGWELSSGNLTKNVTVSGAAITETIPSATAIIYPFYVDGTGYDSFTNAYKAVVNGGTITLGQDATERLDAYSGKNFTIDLHGNAFTGQRGYCCDHVTIRDSVGGGSFSDDEVNLEEGYLDLSGLDPNQIVGKISCIKKSITVSFPVSMSLADCSAKITGQVTGTKIVVNGDTYVWNGTAWVAQTTPEGDWFVSSSGNDTSNDGQSADHPFKTIHRAVEAASDNQTICILAGTYTLTNRIDLTGKNIKLTFVGEGWDKTIVNAAPGKGCFKLDGGSKLVGLTLTGGSYGDGAGVRIINGSVSWCKICNNTGTGTTCGGAGVSFTGGQGSIDHCIVCTNVISTVNDGSGWGAGIGAKGLNGDVLIDTCLVYGNTNNKGSAGGIGFDEPNHKVTVRNCTIVGNTGSSNVGGLYFNNSKDGAELVLVNNIITQNINGGNESNTFIEKAKVNTTESSKCLITGTTANYSASIYKDVGMQGLISDCLTTAPTFAGTGDYHLATGSAGIAAGATYAGIGEDLDHNAFAATPSIGCYEYDGVAPTTYAVTWSGAANATVSAKVDDAAITSGAMVANGKSVVFTVTPNSGYQFTSASDGWTLSGSSLSGTFTLDGSALAVTIPNATAIPSTDPVVPSIGSVSASVSADQKSVTITIDNVEMGTDASGSSPALSYNVMYEVKDENDTVKMSSSSPVLSGRTGSSASFTIANFSNSGVYTCEVWIENNQGVSSARVKSDSFTVVSDSDEPVLELGWTGAKLTADSSSVKTNGYLVFAYNHANDNFQVGSVPFASFNVNENANFDSHNFAMYLGGNAPSPAPAGAEAGGYLDMLSRGYWYNGGTQTITLKNLTVGRKYLVQFFCYRNDSLYNAGHVTIVGEELQGETYITSGAEGFDYGGTIIGVFTADAATKVISVDSTSTWCFNGIQLRDLSDPEHVSIESIKEAYSISGEPTATQIRTGIQAAIDRAAPAHMPVYLEAGTYMIDDQLNVTNGVQLIGAGMDQTIIDRGLSPAAMSSLDWKIHRCVYIDDGAKIEGMTVKGAAIGNKNAGGAVWVKNGTVSWCHVCENFAYSANVFGAGISFEAGQGTADHCIVDHNILGDTGNTAQGMCGAVGIANTTGSVLIDTCLVASNTVYASGNSGIYVETATGKTSVGKWVIRNCTVVGNSSKSNAGGIVSYTINGGGQLTLANNIVVGNFLNGAEKNISLSTTYLDATTSTNNFYGLQSEAINTITGSSLYGTSINGGNSRFGDPGFVDAEHGNYHLNDCSLAAGAGVSYAGLGVDLAGVAFANPPSIGCYEYNGTGIQPVAGNATATRQGIQAAIDAVAPAHGTVHLGAGLFELDQQLMVTNGVTLTGKGMDATILKYVGAANTTDSRVATLSDRATLSHVAVTGASASGNGAYGGAVKIQGTVTPGQEATAGGTVSWCCVTNNTAGWCYGSGIGIYLGGYARIDHTIVAYNETIGYSGAIGARPGLNSNTQAKLYLDVDTCCVFGNKSAGAGAGFCVLNKNETESGGVGDLGVVTVTVRNSTFAGNQVTGTTLAQGAGGFYTTQKNTTLTNCIFSDNTIATAGLDPNIAVWSASASEVAAKTSYCFFGNGTTPFGTDAVSSEGSVGFKSAENGDYRLAELSPAIDAGRMTAEMEVDLNGEAWATPPSIGCYEYDGENVDAPVFSPASGTRSYPEIRVTLACATDGATIRYTTDGSEPTTENGTVYGGGMINLSTENPVTVKARAFKPGVEPSGIVTAYYNGLVLPVAGDAATTRKTIQDAIDEAAALSPAGTVYLGEGLFEIDKQLYVTNGVTLLGLGWEKTVIKQTMGPADDTRCAVVDQGASIIGMTLTGARMYGGNNKCGGAVLMNGGTISWCCITNNHLLNNNTKFGGGIGFYQNTLPARIDHTIIADNVAMSQYGTSGGGGIGGYIPKAEIVIDTCLITGNTSYDSTDSNSKGGGIGFDGAAAPITIQNTTIADNKAGTGAGVADGGAVKISTTPKLTMKNCIVAGNTTAGNPDTDVNLSASGSGTITVDYCLFDKAADKLGVNSIVGDPSFLADSDYHLVDGSPAAGTGMWYDGIVDDLDGEVREVPVSMGCYNGIAVLTRPVFDLLTKGTAVGTNSVVMLGAGVSSYTVSFAYGPAGSVFDEDDYIEIDSSALLNEVLTVTATELSSMKTYAYSYKAVENDVAEPKTYYINGKFTAPDWPVLKLSRPKAVVYSKGADVSVSIMRIGAGATVADVSVQWGSDYDHLCDPVHLRSDAVEGQDVGYSISGLQNLTPYVYQFIASNGVDTVIAKGTFTTLAAEGLVLKESKVSELTTSSAKVSTTLVTVGEDAKTARIELKWGTAPDALSNTVTLDEAAMRGADFNYTISDLSAKTLYYYEFTAENDRGEKTNVSSRFMTDDPALETATRYGDYTTPDAGKVITYDADAAGDPSTLEPGKPYCVVDATGYNTPYTSTVKANQVYAFRSEADFQYNASARIERDGGYVYYLFLSDAVDDVAAGETIELLRNNYAVGKTMVINKKVSIKGNGYTVKVAYPFAKDSGYVDPECTTTPKTVFQIANGGDAYFENMQVMGGGEHLGQDKDGNDQPGANTCATPAIIVANNATGGNDQAGSTGILEMDHVTVMRSQGGLIVCDGAKAYLKACNLVRNVRYCGGGLYNHGILVMVDSSLSENRSLYSAGGGAAAENQGYMYMNNCVVCNNASTEYGGAINNLHSVGNPGGYAYVMNTTFAGNFTSNANDDGGGIGTHLNGNDFYMVNSLLCNNYWYKNKAFTVSDFKADAGNNYLIYSVIGGYSGSYLTKDNIVGGDEIDINSSDVTVFKSYTIAPRVYQHATETTPLYSVALANDPEAPLARYAPLDDKDSAADIGSEGVYTYFDASRWRDGVVKMSYKTTEGTMTQVCSSIPAATVNDEVTTYYETAFVPNVSDRELGVVGASGFGTLKKTYTLKLVKNPEHGSASKNLSLNGVSYNEGTSVTVIATPDAACTFIGWYDENDVPKSTDASYTFIMDSDKQLYPKFTPPAPTKQFIHILCEQEKGTHDEFKLTVTTNWLGMAFGENGLLQSGLAPGGIVADKDIPAIEAWLNTPDAENGLNHIWQNYVLGGLKPHDPNGRIWIQADQVQNSSQLKFFANALGKTQSCGFDVQYRLSPMEIGTDEDFMRTDYYQANSSFDSEPVGQDKLKYRVIDMIFIPDGYKTSWEYVTTVNTAGVLKVESDKKVEILASPFVGFSPSNNPPITATLYAKASCLSKDDVLYVYDRPNSNYLAWAVGGEKTWEVKDTYLIKDGVVQYQHEADASRTNSLDRGLGAWLERKDPKSPIYLFGQVDPSPVSTTLEAGFNLVGNPYPYEFDASKLSPAEDEKGVPRTGMYGDHIVIPTGGAPINSYYHADESAWMVQVDTVVTNGINPKTKKPRITVESSWSTEGLTLPLGHGFWYNNTSGCSVNLDWPIRAKASEND